jgi:ribosomal protein S18 acetylase RimI-like enzyme
MDISPGNRGDLTAVMDLVRDCISYMESQGIHQWDELYPNCKVFEKDLGKRLLYLAKEEEGQCLGMVTLHDYQPAEYALVKWQFVTDRFMVIHRLAVHPHFEGQGLAKRLMEFAEEKARDGGYEAIRLDAFTENPRALGLYNRLGYRNAGTVTFRNRLFLCFEKKSQRPR